MIDKTQSLCMLEEIVLKQSHRRIGIPRLLQDENAHLGFKRRSLDVPNSRRITNLNETGKGSTRTQWIVTSDLWVPIAGPIEWLNENGCVQMLVRELAHHNKFVVVDHAGTVDDQARLLGRSTLGSAALSGMMNL